MASTSIPVPSIDMTGCHLPAFADILAGVQAAYKGIYGNDINLDNSTQDAQWLALIALALNDYCAAILQAYNAYSPATAQGAGLSSIVKTNGIARDAASYSTCDLTIIGQAGRTLTGVVAEDANGYLWSLPSPLTIPLSGELVETSTCQTLGAISAAIGTITGIRTPQRGLQSITNNSDATLGAAVETDPQLRFRQGLSVALPSQTVLDGILADILTIPGVARATAYENDLDTVDANGIPAHGTAFVVDGGDATAIATAIALKKTQGSPTYGTLPVTVLTGRAQIPRVINFFRPTEPLITYNITVKALPGYTLDTQAALQQAVSDWTNALGIGTSISINDVYEPALSVSLGGARPYKVLSILAARGGANPLDADVAIAFNEAPSCIPANVNVAAV